MTRPQPATAITLRDIFASPGELTGQSQSGWSAIHDKVKEELKSVKTASMPELAPKIGDMLDIPIPEVLIGAWKKATEIQALLYKSKNAPDETFWTGLAENNITSEHHPCVEIKIKEQTVKKIEFTIRLLFKLKGFVLTIRDGSITQIQTGKCEAQGSIEYQGLKLAEKKLEPIFLPGAIEL
jgi:hypothetical protein